MNGRKEDVLFRIPGASVHLLENKEVIELAKGDLTILRITEGGALLATVVKIGPHLQWPLTKDEPVVKLDQLHYLFTLPDDGGGFLNYGVSFAGLDGRLASLELFLKENGCFSVASNSAFSPAAQSFEAYWRACAPKIEDYNGVLAKAIAGGTGEIVKGIFRCSSIYSNQIQKGAALISPQAMGIVSTGDNNCYKKTDANKNRGEINKSLRRVREISEVTENMSRSLLNGVVAVTSIASIPLVRSKAGRALLASVPGEVVLASLDAINKVVDAVEAVERKTFSATSDAISGAVSKRFGESAGEATEDVFATAGHAIGTAWNVFKIRKALKPSSVSSSMLKSAVKNKI